MIDPTRQESRSILQGQPATKEYDKPFKHGCNPLLYSNKLLKHQAPLWETNTYTWHKLITSHHTDSPAASYHISPTKLIANLLNGDKPGPKTTLRTAIDTLRATLLLPATTEHRKLPKPKTTNETLIHHTWYTYLNTRGVPAHTPTNFETLIKRSSNNITSLQRPAATQILPSPITPTTFAHGLDVLEIDNIKIQIHNTIYHVK
jgi:hypothetical protein